MPELTALALDIGFECASEFDAGKLTFSPEVRGMCASGRCKRYGKCWSCPPACGTIEALEARAGKFSRCVLVQTVSKLDGDFDVEGLRAAEALHKRRFDTLTRQARLITRGDCLPMGAGSCTRCVKCTYPDKPCRPSRQALAEYGGLRHTRVQRMQKRRARLLSRPGNDNVFILHTYKFIN